MEIRDPRFGRPTGATEVERAGVPVLSEAERFVRQVTIESHVHGVRGEGRVAKGEGDELTS